MLPDVVVLQSGSVTLPHCWNGPLGCNFPKSFLQCINVGLFPQVVVERVGGFMQYINCGGLGFGLSCVPSRQGLEAVPLGEQL
jgi:hypothetical protein